MSAPGETSHNVAAARHGSVGQIEITDDKGRRKTVQLDELTSADRELAEKFGYKPVRFAQYQYLFSPVCSED